MLKFSKVYIFQKSICNKDDKVYCIKNTICNIYNKERIYKIDFVHSYNNFKFLSPIDCIACVYVFMWAHTHLHLYIIFCNNMLILFIKKKSCIRELNLKLVNLCTIIREILTYDYSQTYIIVTILNEVSLKMMYKIIIKKNVYLREF
jgi:hypothetical protein